MCRTFFSLALALLCTSGIRAQTLSVRDATTGAHSLAAAVGDTLSIEIAAELGALPASGFAVFVSVPAEGLSWLPGTTRPFAPGNVFTGAIEFANGPVAVEQSWGVPEGAILLNYAAVLGPGTVAERSRGGNGTIATLRAVCTAPIEAGRIAVFDNSVHQTRVVLSDGRTELRALPPVDLQLTSTESAPTSGTDAAARSGNESWGHIKQRGRR